MRFRTLLPTVAVAAAAGLLSLIPTAGAAASKLPPCAGATYHMQCVNWRQSVNPRLGPTGTELLGFDDYGGGVPAAFAKAEGMSFAESYLSGTPGKDWTLPEVRSYHALGLGVVAVEETTGTMALTGYSGGVQVATAAAAEASSLGEPSNRPICFADDADTTAAQVEPFYEGVDHVIGTARDCAYGSDQVVTGLRNAGLISYEDQTVAWSGGEWSPQAAIEQTSINNLLGSYSIDKDVAVRADYGQFFYTPPPPAPTPANSEEYGWYPDNQWVLEGQNVRERATVETWDSSKCENPVLRTVCKTTRYHLQLLLGRDQGVYATQTNAERTANHTGGRIQELVHRLTATKPILTWDAGL